MKKYDKITSRSASKSYLHMVDNSYIGSYDGVTRLMERVEATFIKHFTNANRSKGIRILRPAAKRERHRTTFSLGFFAGCAVALLASLILGTEGSTIYMESLFPLYSLFGFIVLHMPLYAINGYAWRRYRVNYPFIFGFKQGTELGYREVFLISSALATLALASVLANLDMEMNKHTKDFKTLTELVPLMLVIEAMGQWVGYSGVLRYKQEKEMGIREVENVELCTQKHKLNVCSLCYLCVELVNIV